MGADKQDRETLEKIVENFNLELKIEKGGELGLLDKILSRDTRASKGTAFIFRDRERFDILEEEEPGFAGYTDRSVGEFLGHPGSASDFYSEAKVPGEIFKEKQIRVKN